MEARLVDLAYLASQMLPSLKDVAACRVVNYHHVVWVKGEHLMVV